MDGGAASQRHLAIQPRCGACADRIFDHQETVALYGNQDSTAYLGHTRPFLYPQSSRPISSQFRVCPSGQCNICNESSETACLHYECFVIFLRTCPLPQPEALCRLWTMGLYHTPYPQAPLLYLEHHTYVDRAALAAVAKTGTLGSLLCLPLEVIELIRRLSSRELFWRAVAVVDLATSLPISGSHSLTSIPISEIESWKRGEVLVSSCKPLPPYIRITVDAHGIRKLERLPEKPKYAGEHHQHLSYIVEKESSLLGCKLFSKHGCLRLGRLWRDPPPPIWDTPAPPDMRNCVFHPVLRAPWRRPRMTNLSKLSGITFFFFNSNIWGVHPHELANSSAESTFEKIPEKIQSQCIWVYLPIGAADNISAIGYGLSGYGAYVLVRTDLTGDSVAGTPRQSPRNDKLLCAGSPITLIYHDPPQTIHIPPIGALQPASPLSPKPIEFQVDKFVSLPGKRCFSSASLEATVAAQVFYNQSTGFCCGILFHYANGGVSAVGQCRINVDPSERYVQPSKVCIWKSRQPSVDPAKKKWVSRVLFEYDGCRINHEDAGWSCHPLLGKLNFWFSNTETRLEIALRDDSNLEEEEL